ncbi:MAG TPA: hypothetical protein VJ949_14985 [Cryomorphaceae bacterium]|nr:hypothetical protein [Cryomorphaceae bacterium]
MNPEYHKDFLTYLLLFATHADFECDADERNYILSKVDEETLNRVDKIFQKQNDIQRLDRIRAYLKQGNYSEAELDGLIKEVVAVCHADGDYSTMEQNLMIWLKRILKG